MSISAENWERIDRLFSQALEVAPEARNAFLSKQCSDQAVIGRVRELLASHEKADGFLNDEHRAQMANGVMRTALTFKEGDLLADRFKIVRFIDRGGMGDVYEAEDVYLHMQVAIKAIRPDLLDVPGFQERFKREVKLAKEVAQAQSSATRIKSDNEFRAWEIRSGQDSTVRTPVQSERRTSESKLFATATRGWSAQLPPACCPG